MPCVADVATICDITAGVHHVHRSGCLGCVASCQARSVTETPVLLVQIKQKKSFIVNFIPKYVFPPQIRSSEITDTI